MCTSPSLHFIWNLPLYTKLYALFCMWLLVALSKLAYSQLAILNPLFRRSSSRATSAAWPTLCWRTPCWRPSAPTWSTSTASTSSSSSTPREDSPKRSAASSGRALNLGPPYYILDYYFILRIKMPSSLQELPRSCLVIWLVWYLSIQIPDCKNTIKEFLNVHVLRIYVVFPITKMKTCGLTKPNTLQRSAKVGAPGLVNFITAVAYHFCPAWLQTAAFTQPGAATFADLCIHIHALWFIRATVK